MKPNQNPIKRFQRTPTRKNAIDAKCAECMGCSSDYLEPGFRESISTCSSKGCPLYSFRPYRAEKSVAVGKGGRNE